MAAGATGSSNVDFELLYIQPLSAEEVQSALAKRVTLDSATKLVQILTAAPALSGMASKPVVVELITKLSDSESLHVQSGAEVYAFVTNKLLLRNIASGATFTSTRDKLIFLCELGWEMVSAGDVRIHFSRIPDSIRRHFAGQLQGRESLDIWDIDMRSQTLLHRDPAGYYEFAHRSLAEYFAALKLAVAIGDINRKILEAYQQGDNNEGTVPQPISSLDDLMMLLGRFAFRDPEMNAVFSFLVETLSRASSQVLLRILRTTGRHGYAQANAATLLVRLNVSLAKEDLSNRQLNRADLGGADLRGANLAQSDLTGADLTDAYLAGANLRSANLTESQFDHVSGVKTIRFSGNSETVLSRSSDGLVQAWDTRDGRLLFGLHAHLPSRVSSLCASRQPHDGFFVTGGDDGWIRVWDMGKRLSEIPVPGDIVSVDLSPDGRRVAAMDWGTARVTVWELASGRRIQRLIPENPEESRAGYDVQFSPDGEYLAAAHLEGGAAIWALSEARIIARLIGHNRKVECVTFAGEGKYVVTAGYDCVLNIWEGPSWKLACSLRESAMIADVAVSSKDNVLITALHNGSVGIWDLALRKRKRAFRSHRGSVFAAAITPEGRIIASGGQDATIVLRDTAGSVVTINQDLRCPGLNLEGVHGLRDDTRRILLARGAHGNATRQRPGSGAGSAVRKRR